MFQLNRPFFLGMYKVKKTRELKKQIIQVCMTKADARLVEARAIESGQGLSAYCREALLESLNSKSEQVQE